MRRRAAVVRPSPQVLSRGNEALSTTRTSRPRRRAASPAAAPAGPAPTTRTSTAVGIASILRSPSQAPALRRRSAKPPSPRVPPTSAADPIASTWAPPAGQNHRRPFWANRSGMNIAVCVKQIPDPATPGELDPETKTLKREGKLILDDSDAYGVEMALQLVDAAGGGEVTLLSIAPNGEGSGLRTALAMGAAKAVLVSDPVLQGSDALSTAKVIAKAVERAGEMDLVLTATESTDGYTGTVPQQGAELLGCASLTFAKHIETADGKVKIQRQTEAGYDIVEASLPAVVSVTAGVVEPRYPSFKGIMAAKNKPVDNAKAADLGLSEDEVGWKGARQEIKAIGAAPEPRAGGKDADEGDA